MVRLSGRLGGNGHTAFEFGDGAAEGFGEIDPPADMSGHHRRDDLGIGGDRSGDAQSVVDLDVGVVVYVAVEHGHGVGGATVTLLFPGKLHLLTVHRMTVGFADDPHAGPTGVAEHGHLGRRVGERDPQQVVGLHRCPQHGDIVAELADLACSLVDQAEAAIGQPHRPGLEQGVATAGGQSGGHRRVGRVEPVVPYEDVDAGAVPAAHLHAIDRAERLLHGQVTGHGGVAGVATCEVEDGAGGAEAIAAHGPHRVAQGE